MAIIFILLAPQTKGLAEIKSIEIFGEVSTKIGQQFKKEQPLAGVNIQIVEIDNEPAEESVREHIFRTNSKGQIDIRLNEAIIEDVREITSIKLKFILRGYRDAYITVGPIAKSHAESAESAEIKENTYKERLKVFLVPQSLDPLGLILESFKIDQNLSIFKKGNLVQSPSPFKNQTGLSYFHIPDDLGTLKRLAGERHTSGSNVHYERVFREVKPLIIAMFDMALQRKGVIENMVLKKIFSDNTGIELFKVVIPAGKSFTSNLEELSDDDIRLRIHTFRLMGEMLRSLGQEEAAAPMLKRALKKYGTLFRGFFEPVFTITIRNNSKYDYILKQITVEIKEVVMYAGGEEKGKIPIAAIYDIPIEPKAGITEIAMDPELRIFPKGSTKRPDVLSFKIRLIPQTPYLHSYLMRFKILTDRNTEISTPFFVIDM